MTEEYIEYVSRIRRYSAETCDTYRRILDEYSRYVSELRAEDRFSVTTVRNYEVYLLQERRLSARSVSLHLSVLSGYCRFLMRRGVLQANPVHLVTRPRQEKRLPEFYRRESLESYFQDHCGVLEYGSYEQKLEYMTISLLYGCGIRRSELISLDVNSVDLPRRVLRVRGKGDKMREIPLTSTVCQEISLYLQSADSKFGCADADGMPLLRTASGARLYPVLVDRLVKQALEGVEGISGRRSPHVLRHTLATELLGEGTDLNSIKELLGHSSLAATQVYTHNSVERLKTVYNQAHPRAKKTYKMEIKLKALKFDAGEKLTAFVEKKVSRLAKFFESATQEAEVTLENLKEGKKARISIHVPGEELIIERIADTFENAITEGVDAMKEKLTRSKEKKFQI